MIFSKSTQILPKMGIFKPASKAKTHPLTREKRAQRDMQFQLHTQLNRKTSI